MNRQDGTPLLVANLVDCPECGTTFDVVFPVPPEVYELEDLTVPLKAVADCPDCGCRWATTYQGWTQFGDMQGGGDD